MDTIQKHLALKLKQLREKQGLTQEMLAKKSGVSASYIGMIEACKSSASLKSLDKLAEALSVEPGELLPNNVVGIDSDYPSLTPEEKEFMKNEGTMWMVLNKELADKGVTPEDVKKVMDVLLKLEKK